jgi:hypothetical protein
MKTFCISIIMGLPGLAFARELAPPIWFEDLPATDQSTQHCVVFKTVPGVRYTVESSPDLFTWTARDAVYGLGQEFVTPMYQFTPAPPASPGTLPITLAAPSYHASIKMEPATGDAGGIVVSWASLDDRGPRIVRIDGEMDPGWEQIPIYHDHFGQFNFFVWHPISTVSPPPENSFLGPLDTLMIETLQANLAAMNQQVADSVARSRNSPPPAPTDPNSRKFWRIHCDWSIDTDLDGSPDWAEFEIASRGTGTLVETVKGEAFNADTNGDGIQDGEQLDADLDGTADAMDAAVGDNTATIPIGPVPRYAMFPITNAAPSSFRKAPFQINDRGTVLYDVGTWSGGVWKPLATPDDNPWVSARSINDKDQVLGLGRLKILDDPETFAGVVCTWGSPTSEPAFISIGSDSNQLYAAGGYDYDNGLLGFGPVLSADGHFFAPVSTLISDRFTRLRNSLWHIPAGAGSITEQGTIDGLFFHGDTGAQWGVRTTVNSEKAEVWEIPTKGMVIGSGPLPDLPFAPRNVASYPGGPLIAMPSLEDNRQSMALVNGSWQPSPTYGNALDISKDGIAIGRSNSDKVAPILMNGKWTGIETTAPGVSKPWKESSVKLLDTTPGGWILASRGGYPLLGIAADEFSVMLPLRVDGIDPDRAAPPPSTALHRSQCATRQSPGIPQWRSGPHFHDSDQRHWPRS